MLLNYCQKCLTVLSDPTRAKIVDVLSHESPLTVNKIVEKFKLRQPTISHHLSVLKDSDFVSATKKGNEVYYALNRNCHKDPKIECALLTASSIRS